MHTLKVEYIYIYRPYGRGVIIKAALAPRHERLLSAKILFAF